MPWDDNWALEVSDVLLWYDAGVVVAAVTEFDMLRQRLSDSF